MKLRIFPILILGFASTLIAEAQVDKIAKMIEGSGMPQNYKGCINEQYLISKEANATFKIEIYLPMTYNESQKKYPILLMTDAFYSMGLAQTTFDLLTMGKEIPEVIVVGIDYPYSNMLQLSRNRFRDMMPTHVEGYDPSGNATQFINFIEKELFPYLNAEYRVDSTDRAYFGHSAGGILGGHILIEKPYLFNRYIIGSPSYWWDKKEIIKRLEKKDKINLGSNYFIFSYIGSEEGEVMINCWNTFNKLIIGKIDSNVHFKEQLFEKESHLSVTLSAFPKAVKYIYDKSN